MGAHRAEDPMTVDELIEQAREWVKPCGACDGGLSTTCTHPDGDPREVIAALLTEVEGSRFHPVQRAEPVTYPIREMQVQAQLPSTSREEDKLRRNGALWDWQQKIFHARMSLLKGMIRDGQLPVDVTKYEIWLRTAARTVDYHATQGRFHRFPEDHREILVYGWSS